MHVSEDKILAAIQTMENRLTSRLDGIDERLDRIEDELAEVREHAEITRYATNQLGEWADNASQALNILPTKMFAPVE